MLLRRAGSWDVQLGPTVGLIPRGTVQSIQVPRVWLPPYGSTAPKGLLGPLPLMWLATIHSPPPPHAPRGDPSVPFLGEGGQFIGAPIHWACLEPRIEHTQNIHAAPPPLPPHTPPTETSLPPRSATLQEYHDGHLDTALLRSNNL